MPLRIPGRTYEELFGRIIRVTESDIQHLKDEHANAQVHGVLIATMEGEQLLVS